ncbi:MAG TPA: glycosyltransferase family 2 protein [Gemmataceae bacterium]|jgi:cellulose synthase/poly-beta-1,6-N-acetylglucosamine synthase-like glycosyltransferase|nr:glycosyltransferase family 2 protein [Gemmataceae bacterium]
MRSADWVLLSAAVMVAIPFGVLAVEALASLLPARKGRSGDRPRCAVIVPAHNEEAGIAATIQNLRDQLLPGDRLLVVADNCSDGTAIAARAAGAEVSERTDLERRGKGYALDHGISLLIADPPEVVVIVDADCVLTAGSLDALVREAAATNRPAQGVYLIGTGLEADPRRRLSAFAVLLKNEIRPRGLDRLGMPCLLTGTGMAFPWLVLRGANLGTGNIVEDMKLGADLALAGYPPRLCTAARLSGAAAPDRQAAIKQRTRWEHGHVQTLVTQVPRLIASGLVRLRPQLIGLGLELLVPPLSLLVVVWAMLLLVCLMSWQFFDGNWLPVAVLAGFAVFAIGAIFASWVKFGRRMLPLSNLLRVPLYIVWKLPIYLKIVGSREKTWVRTERDKSDRM